MDTPTPLTPLEEARALIDTAWTLRRTTMTSPPATEAGMQEVAARIRGHLTDAAALCRAAGATRELAAALGKLGHVEQDTGRGDAALACYEESVAVARRAGHPAVLAHAVRHLGDAHRQAGRLAAAETCYAEALALYAAQDEPPPLDYANALRPMAILKEALGQVDDARALWQRARALYGTVSIAAGVAECTDHLARLG